MLVGAFDSGATSAIAQVAEQRKVPFVVNIAAAPQITEQGYKFMFRNFPTAVDLVHNGLALMRDLFQATRTAPRTAVFMHVNDTFGMANTAAINKILPTLSYLPFKVVDDDLVRPGGADLSVEVAKAKASGADFLMLVCRLNDSILLRARDGQAALQPDGLVSPGSPGMYEEPFYKTLGKYSDYAISNVPWYDPKAKLTALVDHAFSREIPERQADVQRAQRRLHRRGDDDRGRRVQARRLSRRHGARRRAAQDQHQRTHDAGRPDRLQRQGPEHRDRLGMHPEPQADAARSCCRRPARELPPVFPVPAWSART